MDEAQSMRDNFSMGILGGLVSGIIIAIISEAMNMGGINIILGMFFCTVFMVLALYIFEKMIVQRKQKEKKEKETMLKKFREEHGRDVHAARS